MDKRFVGIIIVIAIALGAVFLITNNKAAAPDSSGSLTNHVQGTSSTGVTLVEYGDYQCPACGSYYQPLKEALASYQGKVSFQFRNFPLFSIHPNAIAGARAAEAAGKQNKYFEMHDLLYENQSAWTSSSSPYDQFSGYAKQLGLNLTTFETDFKSSKVNNDIQADLKEGTRLSVDSTPTFFLDGAKISTPENSVAGFSKLFDAAIAKKQEN